MLGRKQYSPLFIHSSSSGSSSNFWKQCIPSSWSHFAYCQVGHRCPSLSQSLPYLLQQFSAIYCIRSLPSGRASAGIRRHSFRMSANGVVSMSLAHCQCTGVACAPYLLQNLPLFRSAHRSENLIIHSSQSFFN